MIPYFKNLKLEPSRVAALFFAILALVATFGVHITDPQLEALKNVASILVTMFGAAELSRSKSLPSATAIPTEKAEAVATEALLSDPPASRAEAKEVAKDLVAAKAPAAPSVTSAVLQ